MSEILTLEVKWIQRQDLRCRSKSRLGQNKKNARKTGGGSSEEIPISSIENDVLDIIKKSVGRWPQ
jgi:hypothetical protein